MRGMEIKKTKMLIAIDGPAGSGKSTVSKMIAKRLGLLYIDTGAMYRALTLKAMRKKIDLLDEAALAMLARSTRIDLEASGATLKAGMGLPPETSPVKHQKGGPALPGAVWLT